MVISTPTLTSSVTSPVQGGLPLECLHGDVLLNQAVEEDGEWGEADVVQRQIGSVVQRLRGGDKDKTDGVRHLDTKSYTGKSESHPVQTTFQLKSEYLTIFELSFRPDLS